jgi:hypothetical protein
LYRCFPLLELTLEIKCASWHWLKRWVTTERRSLRALGKSRCKSLQPRSAVDCGARNAITTGEPRFITNFHVCWRIFLGFTWVF